MEWTNVYVFADEHRPLMCTSEECEFEFFLPPGQYRLNAYGTDLAHTNYDIRVESGARELNVGTIELPAAPLAKLFGNPAPEIREI